MTATTTASAAKTAKTPKPAAEANVKPAVASAKTAKTPKPAAEAKVKPTPKAKAPTYKIGDTVLFLGYGADDTNPPVFTAGTPLYVFGLDDSDPALPCLEVVALEDKEAYLGDNDLANNEPANGGLRAESLPYNLVRPVSTAVAKTLEPVVLKDVGELIELAKTLDYVAIADSIANNIDKGFFYLGGALAHVYHENLHVAVGYPGPDGWETYCQERFRFGGRKGHALIQIYRTYSELNVAPERIAEIGWSKAAILAALVTPENLESLIALAQSTPAASLGDAVKHSNTTEGSVGSAGRSGTSGPTIGRTTITYKLYADQAEQIKNLLAAAAKHFGHDSAEQTFEAILTEWASANLSSEVIEAAAAAKDNYVAVAKAKAKA